MRFFPMLDFQYWVLGFFLGLVAIVLVYLAWGSYPVRRTPRTEEEIRLLEGHEIDTGHDAEKNPVAPFLIFVYLGIALWSLAYMIYIGLIKGVSF